MRWRADGGGLTGLLNDGQGFGFSETGQGQAGRLERGIGHGSDP